MKNATSIDLLNHGYLRLVESWGSDERIIESARMSTAKGFLGWGPNCPNSTPENAHEHDLYIPETDLDIIRCRACDKAVRPKPGDEKLLAYLYNNRHDTPFEFAGMVVEVRAPIIVFREWHRHRVPWSYNEASARYAPLPALDFVPTVDRCMRGGGHLTKQAGTADGAKVLTPEYALAWTDRLDYLQRQLQNHYQDGLDNGIPKELARGAMTVFRFSTMRAHANLRGWLHMLHLRTAPNAQEEIRVYAEAAATLLRGLFPRTMELFDGAKARHT